MSGSRPNESIFHRHANYFAHVLTLVSVSLIDFSWLHRVAIVHEKSVQEKKRLVIFSEKLSVARSWCCRF